MLACLVEAKLDPLVREGCFTLFSSSEEGARGGQGVGGRREKGEGGREGGEGGG